MCRLVEFRHGIMMPMIAPGLALNRHILEFYSRDAFRRSTYPSLLSELIRNGLPIFNTSSKVSLVTIVVIEAGSRPTRSTRLWAMFNLLIKLLHKLGASFQETNEQKETLQRMLRLTGENRRPESALPPILEA